MDYIEKTHHDNIAFGSDLDALFVTETNSNNNKRNSFMLLSTPIRKQTTDSLMHTAPKTSGVKNPGKKTWKIMNNTSAVNSSLTETNTKPYYAFGADFEVPVLACYIIIAAVGIFGNLMVCYAIMVDRNLRNNSTTLLLLSLALSDLLTMTISAPFDIDVFLVRGIWVHEELFCKISSVMFNTTVPTWIWTLFAISVDRYKSLSDPLNRFRRSPFMTRKRALIINFLIWLYSVAFASIPLMGWREAPSEPVVYKGICWFPYPPPPSPSVLDSDKFSELYSAAAYHLWHLHQDLPHFM